MLKRLIGWLAAIFLAMPGAAMASFSNMYVFGDSLSDSGNLYAWTDSDNPVTRGTPIPVVPFYSAGRFQNGPQAGGNRSCGSIGSSHGDVPVTARWSPRWTVPNTLFDGHWVIAAMRQIGTLLIVLVAQA